MNADAERILEAGLNDERQTLEVTWGDGHRSEYPLKYLRAECPCAGCRTEREEAKANPFRVLGPGARPPSAKIINVEEVGRYGMRITWGDGHATGIYTFDYLREICPCEACRAARKEEPPFFHGIGIPG